MNFYLQYLIKIVMQLTESETETESVKEKAVSQLNNPKLCLVHMWNSEILRLLTSKKNNFVLHSYPWGSEILQK